MSNWLKQIEEAERRFREETYPRMTFEERRAYWADTLGRAMRAEEKAGRDPYGIYSPEWRANVGELEPEFDRIMETLFRGDWQGVWDENRYRQKIQHHEDNP